MVKDNPTAPDLSIVVPVFDERDSLPELLGEIVPADPQKPYDMREVVSLIVDDGEFFEVHEHFALSLIHI